MWIPPQEERRKKKVDTVRPLCCGLGAAPHPGRPCAPDSVPQEWAAGTLGHAAEAWALSQYCGQYRRSAAGKCGRWPNPHTQRGITHATRTVCLSPPRARPGKRLPTCGTLAGSPPAGPLAPLGLMGSGSDSRDWEDPRVKPGQASAASRSHPARHATAQRCTTRTRPTPRGAFRTSCARRRERTTPAEAPARHECNHRIFGPRPPPEKPQVPQASLGHCRAGAMGRGGGWILNTASSSTKFVPLWLCDGQPCGVWHATASGVLGTTSP